MEYINPVAVPPVEFLGISRTALRCIKDFFEDPENQKDFERWKEERENAKQKQEVADFT